jgi:hypothetical protein
MSLSSSVLFFSFRTLLANFESFLHTHITFTLKANKLSSLDHTVLVIRRHLAHAYVLNITHSFVTCIISYTNVVSFICILLLQFSMDGNYQRYTVGCTPQHREGRGKLFRFPRNPVWFVHKITEQMCLTTYSYAIQPIFGTKQNTWTLPQTDSCVITECSFIHYNKSCSFFCIVQF